jgi:hypothetical protein
MFQEGITIQFLQDILNGVHQPGDTYKIALYTKADAADKNVSLKAYNTTGELPNVGNYRRGGIALSGFAVHVSGRIVSIDWADAIWPNATFSADSAVIYNASRSNAAMGILEFPMTIAQNGPFTIEFPVPGPSAVIALAASQ